VPYSAGDQGVQYTLKTTDSKTVDVVLAGILNEDSEIALQGLVIALQGFENIIFDFNGLATINSLGVRAWVLFLRQVETHRTLVFKACSAQVIHQVNMIPNFLGKAHIESFWVNYICESCDKIEKKLIQTSSLPAKTAPTPPPCPSCQKSMESEEIEDEYFAFLMQ